MDSHANQNSQLSEPPGSPTGDRFPSKNQPAPDYSPDRADGLDPDSFGEHGSFGAGSFDLSDLDEGGLGSFGEDRFDDSDGPAGDKRADEPLTEERVAELRRRYEASARVVAYLLPSGMSDDDLVAQRLWRRARGAKEGQWDQKAAIRELWAAVGVSDRMLRLPGQLRKIRDELVGSSDDEVVDTWLERYGTGEVSRRMLLAALHGVFDPLPAGDERLARVTVSDDQDTADLGVAVEAAARALLAEAKKDSAPAARLLGVIWRHARAGGPMPPDGDLAAELGCSPKSVSRYRKHIGPVLAAALGRVPAPDGSPPSTG